MSLRQDVTYAARVLRRSPLFTSVAVLSLAIGIAGNAAIFSLADALLLRPRPGIGNPAALVDVGRSQDGEGFDNFSYPNYVDLRDRNTVFSGLAAMRVEPRPVGLGGDDGGAERVFGTTVSGNYFDVLQVPMAAGRTFLAEEDVPGAGSVAVLSHALWTRRFDADPRILGSTIRLNGRPFTVVGVAAEGFTGTTFLHSDVWMPVGSFPELSGDDRLLTMRAGVWLQAIGRLREGATIEQAQAAVAAIGRDLEREYPADNDGRSFVLTPSGRVPGFMRPVVGGFIALLFTLVALVLLIACSNVAGMLLARGVGRTRELAIRLAVGAGPRRIVRQLVVESVLLALAGGLLGVVGSFWIVRVLRTLPLQAMLGVPIAIDVRVDWRLAAFSAAIALVTGTLFGLAPALQAVRTDLAALRAEGTAHTAARQRLRQGFLVAQIAMSVLLVVVAALFLRSLRFAGTIDPGFSTERVEVVETDVRLAGYTRESGPLLASRLLERVQQIPEVESAAYVRVLPLTGAGMGLAPLEIPGRDPADRPLARLDWNIVSGGYFQTLGMPLLRGRTFDARDVEDGPAVAIVNETFAARAWPGEEALGQIVIQAPPPQSSLPPRQVRIVGIVRDAKARSLSEVPRPFIYVPFTQQYLEDLTLVTKRRTASPAIPAVRAAIDELDSTLPIVRAAPLEDITAAELLPNRIAASLAGGVGLISVLLAAIGIYGITAFSVSQRRREIGVRMALGADRRHVLRSVLRQAVVLVGLGAVVGLVAAAFGAQLLSALLYGVRPIDPVSFAIGAALFAAVALAASLIPARRAASVNPVEALRME